MIITNNRQGDYYQLLSIDSVTLLAPVVFSPVSSIGTAPCSIVVSLLLVAIDSVSCTNCVCFFRCAYICLRSSPKAMGAVALAKKASTVSCFSSSASAMGSLKYRAPIFQSMYVMIRYGTMGCVSISCIRIGFIHVDRIKVSQSDRGLTYLAPLHRHQFLPAESLEK